MSNKLCVLASVLLVLASAAFAGCTATTGSAPAGVNSPVANNRQEGNIPQTEMPPGGSPPTGSPPEGMPPGGSGSGGQTGGTGPGSSSGSSTYTFSGVYTLNGGTATEINKQITSDTTDVSGVYVTNGGTLTLVNPAITTSGDTSSNDASSFYGLNGAVLATGGSRVTITGGTISTSGTGANGAIPTGSGTTITLTDVTIRATGNGGHGVMATQGGTLVLDNVNIATTGANGAPLATDRGSGIVTVTGGTITSNGRDSPGIYSTGNITVNGATITSTGTEAAVIEGSNSITLTDTVISGGVEKTGGVMIYQSFSGDAETGRGTFTMTGGSLAATGGPVFFVTNTEATIKLTGVHVTSVSDTLVKAAGTDRWGTSGKNGGTVNLIADGETLSGSLIADNISSISATLKNGSTLTGVISSAALNLDATSRWIVTGNSVLSGLDDAAGISGTAITNIEGNGYTVTYDASLTANRALGGKTYTLANGGTLAPA